MPEHALHLMERAQFVHEHPAYTYEAYDRMSAFDVLFDKEYHAMIAPFAKDSS